MKILLSIWFAVMFVFFVMWLVTRILTKRYEAKNDNTPMRIQNINMVSMWATMVMVAGTLVGGIAVVVFGRDQTTTSPSF